jgi:tRNA A37 threonylcarbamoyladenosine synthetase subunit TsaC/SUA5/YrdC
MEFAQIFEFHHVNHNGDLHRRVMKAFSVGPVTWVLETPAPDRGHAAC